MYLQLLIVLSFLVWLFSAFGLGCLFNNLFDLKYLFTIEKIFIGFNIIAILTFLFTLPNLVGIREVSLAIQILFFPMSIYFILKLIRINKRYLSKNYNFIKYFVLFLLFSFILLTIYLSTMSQVHGDSAVHWALVVKEILKFNSLNSANQLRMDFGPGYPILLALLNINILSFHDLMIDFNGVIVNYIIYIISIIFIFQFFKKYFSTINSFFISLLIYTIIFILYTTLIIGWQSDIPFAVYLFFTSYYFVGIWRDINNKKEKIILFSSFLMFLTFIRPDGFTYIGFFLILTIILIFSFYKTFQNKIYVFLSFVPAILLFSLWKIYIAINDFKTFHYLTIQKLNPLNWNPLSVVLNGFNVSWHQWWWVLIIQILSLFIGLFLLVFVWKKLSKYEKIFSLVFLSLPLFNFIKYFVVSLVVWDYSNAIIGASFQRYMSHTILASLFIVPFLFVKLKKTNILDNKKFNQIFSYLRKVSLFILIIINLFLLLFIKNLPTKEIDYIAYVAKEVSQKSRDNSILFIGPGGAFHDLYYYSTRPIKWLFKKHDDKSSIETFGNKQSILLFRGNNNIDFPIKTNFNNNYSYYFRIQNNSICISDSFKIPNGLNINNFVHIRKAALKKTINVFKKIL